MQEVIGYYITMEEYYMRESVNKVTVISTGWWGIQNRKEEDTGAQSEWHMWAVLTIQKTSATIS